MKVSPPHLCSFKCLSNTQLDKHQGVMLLHRQALAPDTPVGCLMLPAASQACRRIDNRWCHLLVVASSSFMLTLLTLMTVNGSE
jgi:hypothetical protein